MLRNAVNSDQLTYIQIDLVLTFSREDNQQNERMDIYSVDINYTF